MGEDRDRRAPEHRARRRRRAGVLVGLVAVALVGSGLSGAGPLTGLRGATPAGDVGAEEEPAGEDDELAAAEAPTDRLAQARAGALGITSTSVPGTTTPVLERRSYKVGDCVWWDETMFTVDLLDTKVVGCGQPHVMEVTAPHTVKDQAGDYPREAYWDALFDSGPCLAAAELYLGTKLDPNGNYFANGVMPTAEGWRNGDRGVWCGIGVRPLDAAGAAVARPESIGRVSAGNQYRIYPVGSCVGEAGTAERPGWGVVPCDAPHDIEVAGHVDLTNRVRELPPDDGWERVVGADCQRLAKAYAGAALRDPVHPGWLPIEAGSWDAGRRTLLCTVAEYRNDEAATITRRIGP